MTSSSIMLMVSTNYNDSDVDGESIHNNNNGGGSPMVVDEMIVPSTPFLVDERVYFASKRGDEDNNNNHNNSNNNNISDNNNTNEGVGEEKLLFEYFEAIVRQSQYTSIDGWKFFLHFVGWNSRWDRWVDADSIMKDTADMRRKMQQQQSKLSSSSLNNNNNNNNNSNNNNSNKRRTAMNNNNDSKEISSVSSQRPSKRSKGLSKNDGGAFSSDSLIYSDYCELPLTLKTVLIDEYERITRKGYHSPHGYDDVNAEFTKPPRMVHVLPAPVTARKVIEHFEKKKMKEIEKYNNNNDVIITTNDTTDHNNEQQTNQQFSKQQKQKVTSDQIHTFCDGLIELFENAIPTCLLYPQERPQYEYLARKLQQKEPDPTKRQRLVDIYGCEYLLRLIVRLPILLQPIGEAALAVSMSLSTSPINGTTTTSQSSSSASSSSSSAVVTKFEMHDPIIIGPFITELLVLMQKNRQSLFKVTGNFRFPIQGKEWMDYEEKIFGNNNSSNNNTSMKYPKK